MIDAAAIKMVQGQSISCERIEGVNDNMAHSHYHDFFELYYLESGERHHMIEGVLYLIQAGQFVLFPPYVMHHSYGEQDIPFKRIILYFRPTEIQSARLAKALEQNGGVYLTTPKNRYSLHQLLVMMLQEENEPSPFSEEYKHTLLNLMLINLQSLTPQPPPALKKSRMSRVVDYIPQHYYENLSLDALSKEFYVSPYYLCREFKNTTNRTLTQYINITRIMNAQNMIMETDRSITEIANKTGFSNITHFNRVFKSTVGIAPSEYRRQYKKRSMDTKEEADG